MSLFIKITTVYAGIIFLVMGYEFVSYEDFDFSSNECIWDIIPSMIHAILGVSLILNAFGVI